VVTQAIVDIFEDGEAASVQANKLKALGWTVVVSGPDEGVDVQVAGGAPDQRDGSFVVLASKAGIAAA
jgi:hypothetical protein